MKAQAPPAMARAHLALMLAVVTPALQALLIAPAAWQGSKLLPVHIGSSASQTHVGNLVGKCKPNIGLLPQISSLYKHHSSQVVNRWHRHRSIHCSLSLADGVADLVAKAAPSVALVLPVGVRNSTAQGSGFAVTHKGESYLLTSAHVAAGGFKLSVSLPQDDFVAKYDAELVGRAADSRIDLALLKLPKEAAELLPPLELADSDALRTGSFLVAMGHTSGLMGAVSLGILSGRGDVMTMGVPAASADEGQSEEKVSEEPREGKPLYLVTDAAFAGGMSGGPLLDHTGAVVGVNTLVRPELRGIGNYAISANVARQAIDGIIARASSPERPSSIKLVLYNDRFNTRARVSSKLQAAGLSAADAEEAMLAAHQTGRGVIREFESMEEADEMRAKLAAADLLVEVIRV